MTDKPRFTYQPAPSENGLAVFIRYIEHIKHADTHTLEKYFDEQRLYITYDALIVVPYQMVYKLMFQLTP